MKYILCFCLLGLFLSCACLSAAMVSPDDIPRVAESFIRGRYPEQPGVSVSSVEPLYADQQTIGYVAHLEPSGYVLIRPDDMQPPLKLYTDSGTFSNLPPAFSAVFLSELAEEAQYIAEQHDAYLSADSPFTKEWQALLEDRAAERQDSDPGDELTAAGPLLSTVWNQGDPYNFYAPTAIGGPGGRAWIGCTATAMGQIMKYHVAPLVLQQDYSYNDNSGSCTGSHSTQDAGNNAYQWTKMPNAVSTGSSTDTKKAVGQLLYHCAVSVESNFEADGTGASPQNVPGALRNCFGYSCSSYTAKSGYSSDAWYTKIAADIDSRLPVFYAMWQADNSGGHAVVCDGYHNGNQIHLNLGWSGSGNAWYDIDTVIFGSYTWTKHGAVFTIDPPATAPPDTPDAVEASYNEYNDRIEVTWDPVGEAEYYRVFRHTADIPSNAVDVSGTITATVYQDTAVENTLAYYYWVQAGNAAGWSDFSDSAWGKVLGPPLPPDNVKASDGSYNDRVTIQWDACDDADHYRVYRNTVEDSSGAVDISGEMTLHSYTDTGVAAGQMYYYWIKAVNNAGSSAFSIPDAGFADTATAPPAPPENLSASDGLYTDGVRLTWESTPFALHYRVFRGTSNNSDDAVSVSDELEETYWFDTRTLPGCTYYYWVSAGNSIGWSEPGIPDTGYSAENLPSNYVRFEILSGMFVDKKKGSILKKGIYLPDWSEVTECLDGDYPLFLIAYADGTWHPLALGPNRRKTVFKGIHYDWDTDDKVKVVLKQKKNKCIIKNTCRHSLGKATFWFWSGEDK